jgi:hypothetical protein
MITHKVNAFFAIPYLHCQPKVHFRPFGYGAPCYVHLISPLTLPSRRLADPPAPPLPVKRCVFPPQVTASGLPQDYGISVRVVLIHQRRAILDATVPIANAIAQIVAIGPAAVALGP